MRKYLPVVFIFGLIVALEVWAGALTLTGGKWSAAGISSTSDITATGVTKDTVDWSGSFHSYLRPSTNTLEQYISGTPSCTTATNWTDSGMTGTKAWPNIAITGDGHISLSGVGGAVTGQSLAFLGAKDTLIPAKLTTGGPLIIGPNTALYYTNYVSAGWTAVAATGSPLVFTNGGSLNFISGTGYPTFKMTSSGQFISVLAGTPSIPGTACNRMYWQAGATAIADTMSYPLNLSAGTIQFAGIVTGHNSIDLACALQTGASPINIVTIGAPNDTLTFRTNGNSLTTGALAAGGIVIGNSSAGGVVNVYFGNTTANVCHLNVERGNSAFGKSNLYLQTSRWNITSATGTLGWLIEPTTVIDPGTNSTEAFYGTATQLDTNSGQPMYNVIDSMNTGVAFSQGDSLAIYGSWTLKCGKYWWNGHAMKVLGNITIGGADSIGKNTPMTLYLGTPGVTSTFTNTNTGKRNTDSSTYVFLSSVTKYNDSNWTCKRIVQSAGCAYAYQAGKKGTIWQNVVGDWAGTTASHVTMTSTSAGNRDSLYFGVQPVSPYIDARDQAALNYTMIDTASTAGDAGKNLGNDSNWLFKDAIGQYYLTPAIPSLSSASPNSGPVAGGAKDTLTGTKLFAPDSIKLAGTWTAMTVIDSTKAWFTRPAGVRGTVSDTLKNADGRQAVLAAGYTYLASVGIDSVRPESGTTAGGTAITIYDHTGGFFATCTGSLGGVALTSVAITSPTVLTAVTGQHVAATVTASVTNGDAQTGTLASAYTYVNPFSLTSISPSGGDTLGGTPWSIVGVGMGASRGTGKVYFGLDTAATITGWSATLVSGTTKAHAAGVVNVALKDNAGDSTALLNVWTFAGVAAGTPTKKRPSGPYRNPAYRDGAYAVDPYRNGAYR